MASKCSSVAAEVLITKWCLTHDRREGDAGSPDSDVAKAITDTSNMLRKRAWEAGRDAATAGKAETANRRQRGTIYFDDWFDGFESVRPKGLT